jgi:hypothetical protein
MGGLFEGEYRTNDTSTIAKWALRATSRASSTVGKMNGTGLGRVELVTGGRNDREAKYTEILEKLPPAQHLALVRVWQANTEIRVPASFCAQLRRIEAYDAVFRLEGPCPSATEAALFNTDRVRIRTLLDQTPNLEHLTIDRFRHADSGHYSPLPVETMTKLHTSLSVSPT